jgi:hypothetical protein
MRTAAAVVTAAVALALAPTVSAGQSGGAPRVRPLTAQAQVLVTEAEQMSGTVRDLMKKLESENLVVYVDVVREVDRAPLSSMRLLGATKYERYALVQVADCKEPGRKAELLGHELRHASDLATARWITDDEQLQRLMAYVGWVDRASARGYETASAMNTERQVGREVRAALAAGGM